ncbi:hypothetical protein CUT44_14115 [Streptomyces carminius]|uniref:Ribbon-helix-helix protein CopG domain-containing protein n=2 Tax=Streptomyces carminius TaxID=2665496 RepID=A0A2M8LYR0_9ACTN|nr:hypothetical protein CUT44_14115 [Streptomyces carminius]
MPRVNVFAYPISEYGQDGPQLVGWFNPDSAIKYDEGTRWDGNNNVSVNPVGQFGHQALYRTKGGRWVLNTWSQWEGSEGKYEFVDDATAKDWLLRNDEDDAVEQWFGELEEEAGPNLGGRPAVGTKVETRLPDDVLAALDERAKAEGIPRAEMIRRLVAASL